ncbi:MAG TPA: IclR family transcriptional regulator C-terminal domain-containing protein [Streptosporangiaceae bacterium]
MTTSGRRAHTSGAGKPSAAMSQPPAGSDVASGDASQPRGSQPRASQHSPSQHSADQHSAELHAAAQSGRDSDFVQSLDRGLAVIRAFGPGRERLSLSDVARETGLTRAAARRFLLTLVKLGYVRSDGREFSLRPLVLELGYAYLSGLAMPEIASPHLEELVAKVRESSSISVLDGHQIVYVARVPTKRIMTVAISVGTRFPAYATSMGRVLLAGMSPDDLDKYLSEADFEAFTARTVTDPDRLREIVREVGRQGYAIVDQELEEGLRAIAAPIHGAGNAVIAAINLSAHASRVSPAAMRAVLLPALLETAGRIEADLRSQGAS